MKSRIDTFLPRMWQPWAFFAACLFAYLSIAWVPGKSWEVIISILCLLFVSAHFAIRRSESQGHLSRIEEAACIFVVVASAAFFRFYDYTAWPDCYNSEELYFWSNAAKLFYGGLHYVPYELWMHTLLSYLVYPFFFIFDSELLAFQTALALISIASCIIFYFAAKNMYGARSAVFAAILLSFSTWHISVSRFGWQKFLVLPFQIGVVWGLWYGFEKRSLPAFIVAAVSAALGFHSYWGFYPTPLLFLIYPAYLFFVRREIFYRGFSRFAVGVILVFLFTAPLAHFFYIRPQILRYPMQKQEEGFYPNTTTYLQRITGNLSWTTWALTGIHSAPKAIGTYHGSPLRSDFVAGAGLLGLALSLSLFVRSRAVGITLLFVFVNLLGITLAGSPTGNYNYLIALLGPWFLLITIMADYVWKVVRRGFVLSVLTFVAVAVFLGWYGKESFEDLFVKRLDYGWEGPFRPELANAVADMQKSYDVRVVIQQDKIDLRDPQIKVFGESHLQAYRNLGSVKSYDVNDPMLFDAGREGRAVAFVLAAENSPNHFFEQVQSKFKGAFLLSIPWSSKSAKPYAWVVVVPRISPKA